MSPGSRACFHGCVVLGVFEWAGQLACSTPSTRVLLFNCLGAAAPAEEVVVLRSHVKLSRVWVKISHAKLPRMFLEQNLRAVGQF